MRATVMYGAGDVRIENVPDSEIKESTDAILRVTRACICGSDLWPYHLRRPEDGAQRMGHEAIGVVDGTCVFCHEHLQTACLHGGFFGNGGMEGAQAEALRIPQADGTLFGLPARGDDALMPSLLTLSDVMGTGHHAASVARVAPGKAAAIIGDGAVGLCGIIAARRLGAEQIILMGRHPDRIALGRTFGATDIVSERGEEAIARVRDLTNGLGVHAVLECVGTDQAMNTAAGIARAGGAIGSVGVPHYEAVPAAQPLFYKNITVGGGPAPVRAYIEELLPDILEGRIEPGRVFDRTVDLAGVPEGYRAMDSRTSIKVMVQP